MSIFKDYIRTVDVDVLIRCFEEQIYMSENGELPENSEIRNINDKFKKLIKCTETCIGLAINEVNYELSRRFINNNIELYKLLANFESRISNLEIEQKKLIKNTFTSIAQTTLFK